MSFEEMREFLKEKLRDEELRIALERSRKSYLAKRRRYLEKYSYIKELAKEVRSIKERAVSKLDELVRQAMDSLEENKVQVHLARTADMAREIVGDIVGSHKLVVKAKSITTDEIGLRSFLQERGNEVWETDLGELIVQWLGSKPMHFITPAINVRRERVAELIREKIGAEVDPDDIPEMTKVVRRFLREKFIRADFGVTGANVLSADTGSLFLITNEGNGRLVTALPEVHIAVVGVEKIVPTLEDAFKVCDVIMKYAGYGAVAYLSAITGPSKTGDIEKTIVYGAHGPREVHVILLDNGRMKASRDPVLREALYCLRCGSCQYLCPVFDLVGGYWGGDAYVGGIGVLWNAITGRMDEAMIQSFFCLGCGKCKEVCPMNIKTPEAIREIRARWMREKLE